MAGVNMLHVPYRGVAPALTDLLSGQVQVMFLAPAASIEYIGSGRLRALAVTSATRWEGLPDVPTVGDFLPGFEASALVWHRRTQGASTEIIGGSTQKLTRALPTSSSRHVLPSWAARRFRHARRLWKVNRRRNRQMGQGGEVRGHQSGLTRAVPAARSITLRCRSSE